jgi:hypothetical protein
MPMDSSLRAVEAVVDTIAPDVPEGPGGVALGVHRHVSESIEAALPGFVDMLAMLLDGYASEARPGASFADLDPEERGAVLRAMGREDSQDMKELVGALFLFTYGGMYSEWTGYDRATRDLEPPQVWRELGFRGPVRGNPEYRADGR